MKANAIYIGSNSELLDKINRESLYIRAFQTDSPLDALKLKAEIDLILFEEPIAADAIWYTKFIKEHLSDTQVKLFVITLNCRNSFCIRYGADDVFSFDAKVADIDKRFVFLKEHTLKINESKQDSSIKYQIPAWKRATDILFALGVIILISPILLLIAFAIRIESKGKVFYASKRIGAGYKVFHFYKFRSMYTDADKKVDVLKANNQYVNGVSGINTEEKSSAQAGSILVGDEEMILEQEFLELRKEMQENSFFKMANDPRITKVGRIIRNTSLDELPQLFNILKGDMSVVGNRPLPTYEAELLTSDQWAQRFLAPAGLTGLWQVTKRGGANKMSADERKQLDIDYANSYSFFGDLMIILKTFPALLQHENV